MTLEYATLAVYFSALLLVGTLFSRFNRNLSDFVRGGARGKWWMVGTSITMSGISAFTFTGNGSAAFNAGPSLLVIYLANLLGYAAGGFFLAKWYRQTRAFTVADVIRGRFGTVVEQFSIYTGVVLAPLGAAVQLWALAVFVGSVLGFSLQLTIVGVGLIVLVYSVSGGAWAVMATDVVQGIVLFSITIIVAVLSLVHIGGIGEFLSYFSRPEFQDMAAIFKAPGQFPQNQFTLQWAVVIFFMQLLSQTQMGTAGRYLTVKDGGEGSRAAWWAFCLMAVGSAVWFLPPMVARFLYADEVMALPIADPATGAYAVIAMKVLPNGLMGIMIAAMFAATMSSMDTGLNAQTGIIVHNMLGRIRERLGLGPLSDTVLVRLCRVISTILGLTIICFALLLATQDKIKLFDIFLLMGAVIGMPMILPLIAGLVIRRLAAWSYFLIVAGGLLPSLYALLGEQLWGMEPWTIQERGTWVLLGGTLAVLVSIPLARFASAAQRERERTFFEKMTTPVDFETEIGGGNDTLQALLVGRVALLVAALLCLLLLLPNPLLGRLVIVVLIALVAAIGGLLLRAARGREPGAVGASPGE